MILAMIPREFLGAVAFVGGAWLVQKIANARPSLSRAQEFADLATGFTLAFLKKTPTFDQLLANLVVDKVDPAGVVEATFVPSGPHFSENGSLHEGTLMLIVDDVTGMAARAGGSAGGVSIELSLNVFKSVHPGTKLSIKARALRVGRTIAFLTVDIWCHETGDHVATGTQIKHVGQPLAARLVNALTSKSATVARWMHRRRMAVLDDAIAKHGLKQTDATTMEELISLKRRDSEADVLARTDDCQYEVFTHPALLNVLVAGHGASTAGIFAASLRDHIANSESKGVDSGTYPRVASISVNFMEPVPAHSLMRVSLHKLGSDGFGFRGDIRNQRGTLCAQAKMRLAPR